MPEVVKKRRRRTKECNQLSSWGIVIATQQFIATRTLSNQDYEKYGCIVVTMVSGVMLHSQIMSPKVATPCTMYDYCNFS